MEVDDQEQYKQTVTSHLTTGSAHDPSSCITVIITTSLIIIRNYKAHSVSRAESEALGVDSWVNIELRVIG